MDHPAHGENHNRKENLLRVNGRDPQRFPVSHTPKQIDVFILLPPGGRQAPEGSVLSFAPTAHKNSLLDRGSVHFLGGLFAFSAVLTNRLCAIFAQP